MAHIRLDEVHLRQFEPEDVEALYRFRNDPEVTKTLSGFSVGYSRKELAERIERLQDDRRNIIWAIALNEKNLCVGHVGLYEIDYRVRKAGIGTLIGEKKLRGRGLGYRVKKAVIEYGFSELNLHKIESLVLENNPASIRINEKLGFKTDGLLRDYQFRNGAYLNAVLMSLLENEWIKKKAEPRRR